MKAISVALGAFFLPVWSWGMSLVVETQPAVSDSSTIVSLFIRDAQNLGYLDFSLSYDWEYLQLQDVRLAPSLAAEDEGILLSSNPETFPDESGRFRLAAVAPRGISGTHGILDLVFAVADSTPEFIEVAVAAASAADTALQSVPVELENGGVGVITAVLGEQEVLPETPSLLPNFPNPFNTGTHIPFQLAAPGQVKLRVYNLLGQVVRDFDLGRLPAGFYTGGGAVRWDGRSDQGRTVASGVYLIRLQAGDFIQVRKALLLK